MGTINTFLFTTGDGTRSIPLPVTLDAVLAMSTEQARALCNFMDPNGDLEVIEYVIVKYWEAGTERDMLTSFVIFHTLFVAIEVARDTEHGVVQEPWTIEGVDAQLQWCAAQPHTAWVVREIESDCRYKGGTIPCADCTKPVWYSDERGQWFHVDRHHECFLTHGNAQDGGAE